MVEAKKTVQKTLLSGVFLLSLSTLLVKLIGLLYKIPMLSILGADGMGYFNSAYEIYALFCVIATAGLPVALSVLISAALATGDMARATRVWRASMAVFLLIGLLGSAAMAFFAKDFCRMIRSEAAYGSILSISPTVFLICVSSGLRGYFQGYQKMLPTAISQLIEAVGKLIFGLLFAQLAYQRGDTPQQTAAAAGWGLTAGTVLSMLYLLLEKLRFSAKLKQASREEPLGAAPGYPLVWRQLARLAIPMTLGASAVSLTKLIDMTMILRRLQAIGFTELAANEAYGSYTTLALSVYGLIPSLLNAVALPLLPMLSAAIAAGDRERQEQMIRMSYQLTALFAIPAALGISAFARPVLLLLFRGESEAIAIAAPLLSLLGVSVFLSCMITATNSVLHAYQSVVRPILAMLAGAGIKVLSAYLLIGNQKIGLFGAPISSFLCNAVVVGLNLLFAARLCRIRRFTEIFWRPLFASVGAVGISYCLYLLLAARLGEAGFLTLVCLALSVLLYMILACTLGAITPQEVLALPMGEKIYHILIRCRLLPADRTEKEAVS